MTEQYLEGRFPTGLLYRSGVKYITLASWEVVDDGRVVDRAWMVVKATPLNWLDVSNSGVEPVFEMPHVVIGGAYVARADLPIKILCLPYPHKEMNCEELDEDTITMEQMETAASMA